MPAYIAETALSVGHISVPCSAGKMNQADGFPDGAAARPGNSRNGNSNINAAFLKCAQGHRAGNLFAHRAVRL